MIGRMRNFVCLFVAAFCCALTTAGQNAPPTQPPPQPPPSTDIFLVSLNARRAGQLAFGQPVNITRREGYDNQPSFLPGGEELLYTSQRGEQTDIYRYDLRRHGDGAHAQLTATAESEYSPTLMPGGAGFSVIRVEADKRQRLWKFPFAGGQPALVLEQIKPVGYHLWIDPHTLALFILGTPNTLQLVDVRNEKAEVIIENIGRSLHLIPRGRGQFSFVHKVSKDEWHVKSFDPRTKRIETIVRTLPSSEDLAWLPDGSLLMGQGAKLYRFDPRTKKSGWQGVADFSAAGLQEITRLSISPRGDQLAFVALPVPESLPQRKIF
ncbi:hypothetical protein BH18ACI2_BH18ACI2_25410 [soil metagenome]